MNSSPNSTRRYEVFLERPVPIAQACEEILPASGMAEEAYNRIWSGNDFNAERAAQLTGGGFFFLTISIVITSASVVAWGQRRRWRP